MAKNKIMIVEDEMIHAIYLQRLLTRNKYDVCPIATHGDQALELSRSEEPDLILMDIFLQGSIDGIETTRLIHARKKIPVIFITASTDPETRRKSEVVNASGYLVKPIREEILMNQIADLLQESAAN